MGTEVKTSRSRRELLAGAAGAVGVIAAQGVLGAKTAYAGTDGDVVLGTLNNETNTTAVYNSAGGDALAAGAAGSGTGVFAVSDSGEGLYGQSGSTDSASIRSRNGIHGVTDSSSDAAVWGEALIPSGGAPGSGGNGVHGSTDSTEASGVYGENANTGYGVAGRAASGTGTLGDSANGTGVWANSQNKTGLKATTAFGTAASIISTGGGTALSVTGEAKFNRSGAVTITNPAASARVTVPGGLTSASLVLAVVQNAVAGVWVVRAVPNASTGKATIALNKAPASGSPAKVAWFVVN